VPLIRSLTTSWLGAGPLGTRTAGFFDSGEGGFGVVAVGVEEVEVLVVCAAVTDASVAPPPGASWTPGAFEEPHAARPAADSSAKHVAIALRLIRAAEGSEVFE
jgi:hypothetical protein